MALFWSLFFPMLIMLIFGIIDFDRFDPPDVGVVDRAQNQVSAEFVQRLAGSEDQKLLKVQSGTREEVFELLRKGDVDAVIEVPEGFGAGPAQSTIGVSYDSRKPQQQGIVASVVDATVEELFRSLAQVPAEYRVESRFTVTGSQYAGQGQGYRGFLVPGIAAMAIMQGGLFGVVFTLVAFKSRGILRRLKAAPIGPSHILAGQVVTRLVVSIMQTYVLLLVGVIVLNVTIGRDAAAWVNITLFALLGGALFIAMGLAISGWAKSEDTAAPVANVISLPMMFLSGVFFPVTAMPDWVQEISRFLPLTYLADGMRAVALDGASLGSQWPELVGLTAWTAAMLAVATRLFRWE
jgi:ABC-2 type transport system permease protein